MQDSRPHEPAVQLSHPPSAPRRLAIASERFDLPSETFVRDHVRLLAPGRTVLLCDTSGGLTDFDGPVLDGLPDHRPHATLAGKVRNGIRRRWREHVSPDLLAGDRQRVVRFLLDHNVKVMLAEFADVGVQYMSACEDAGIPLFLHVHGFDVSTFLRRPKWVRWYREIFRRCAGIIAASQFMADKLIAIGCPPGKIHISPLGVDVDMFCPTEAQPGLVLAVGRLVEKKAPHLAIEAFAIAARDHPDARLEVIGDGDLRTLCEATIARLGLSDRVVLHGARDHAFVAERMRQASVFMQHSVTATNGDTEGFGVSLVEAMASSIPLVVTAHNGFPEVIADGVTGFLSPEFDVEGMADNLARFLNAPELGRKMGLAGRQRVEDHFTHTLMARRLGAILELDR